MAFEVYVPRYNVMGKPLPAHTLRINKAGGAAVNPPDFAAARIPGPLVVAMLDRSNMRLGFRAPREGESGLRIPMKTKKGTPRKRWCFGLAGVLKALRVDPAKIAGDYELIQKDDVLVVHLAERGEALARTSGRYDG